MTFDLDMITTNAIVIVPIVIALVQAVKLSGWIKDHYTPLLAIGIGILISFLGDRETLSAVVLGGAIYGLMASGLYSGVKTTMVAHARMKQRKIEQPLNDKDKNKY